MPAIEKVYETGLLYHHYANTAYPLTPGSFMDYKVRGNSAIRELLVRDWKKITDYSLYLHIPFCRSRCKFCEYTVLENAGEAVENEYVDLLIREMQLYSALAAEKKVTGFDIGGGTPLKLSAENIAKIVGEAEKLFRIGDGVVRSIETTPVIAANEPEKLRIVRELGFQRISMGIQTVSPHLLEELGREGEKHIYEKAVNNIRKAGFDTFNIDLMYGFLNQSDKELENTVLYAIALKPTQITLYRNRYKGTRLEPESGGVSLYKAMRQYQLAYDLLMEHGYFAGIGKNTFSCIKGDWGTSDYLTHRVIEGTPYLGLGLGAQSMGVNYLSYNEGAATKQLENYRSKILSGEFPLQDIYDLPQSESIAKMIAVAFYFGFIDLKCFEKRFGIPLTELYREEIDFLLKRKLMELTTDKLILTKRGAGYINGVIPLFYSERSKEELVRLYERKRVPESEGEEKFLAAYSIEKYPRPSVVTDIVAMTIRTYDAGNYRSPEKRSLSVLLIRRGEHPYMNRWALPGGFLRQGEAVEHCAQRELFEETGLNTNALYPLGCFSSPGRDPRGWIISNAFLSIVGKEDLTLMSGDDAMDARWFDLSFREDGNLLILTFRNGELKLEAELKVTQNVFGQFSFEVLSSDLAFDHAKIIASALKGLQTSYGLRSLAFAFLPAEFTINELQNIHELLTGKEILAANFRRKMLPYLSATKRMRQGEGHRPAQIYMRNNNVEE
ncbi:MAG: NUDIX domain-containing protein [Lentisphaeria bacterium]|nr:NUDIX domain-containing protein [Lentisphaeria bacterium]